MTKTNRVSSSPLLRILGVAVFASALAMPAFASQAAAQPRGVAVRVAPPSARAHGRHGHHGRHARAPSADYVWVDGYWQWNGAQYTWVEGQWIAARPGYAYESPRWVTTGRGHVFHPGRWVRQAPARPVARPMPPRFPVAVQAPQARVYPPPTVRVIGSRMPVAAPRAAVQVTTPTPRARSQVRVTAPTPAPWARSQVRVSAPAAPRAQVSASFRAGSSYRTR